MCTNLLSDLVGIISPFCLLPMVKHRHSALGFTGENSSRNFRHCLHVCKVFALVSTFSRWGRGNWWEEGRKEGEKKLWSSPWAPPRRPRGPRAPGVGKGHMPTPLCQPGTQEPGGHPQALLSLSANPSAASRDRKGGTPLPH